MNRRPPREVVSLRCAPGWCAPVVMPEARALVRPVGGDVQVGAASSASSGDPDATSTTTKVLTALAFAVVVGTIVYASKSAAKDFA